MIETQFTCFLFIYDPGLLFVFLCCPSFRSVLSFFFFTSSSLPGYTSSSITFESCFLYWVYSILARLVVNVFRRSCLYLRLCVLALTFNVSIHPDLMMMKMVMVAEQVKVCNPLIWFDAVIHWDRVWGYCETAAKGFLLFLLICFFSFNVFLIIFFSPYPRSSLSIKMPLVMNRSSCCVLRTLLVLFIYSFD